MTPPRSQWSASSPTKHYTVLVALLALFSTWEDRAALAGGHFHKQLDATISKSAARPHEVLSFIPASRVPHSVLSHSERAAVEAIRRGKRRFYGSPSALRDDLIIGPGNDTLAVHEDFSHEGNIIIIGDGVLIVDGATLSLSGQLYSQNHGKAILQNNARLHFNQAYVGQYYQILRDHAMFEATDAIVDANGSLHYAQLHDSSAYIAKRTSFPDWTFRKVFNTSSVLLEDVDHVGDLIVADSCTIHFTRCDTLMPWFETPQGSVIDIDFPAADFVHHFEFSESVPGVDGIGYHVVADSCSECWWSLETWPACSVVVRNSVIRGSAQRIPGSDSASVSGIHNFGFHSDLTLPLADRHVEYVNTYVYWWNWYPMETTVFEIDSCMFGEMIGKGKSVTHARSCIHDGSTVTMSAIDSAFVRFEDGASWAFVSSWDTATMLLVNTTVVPVWQYQSTNLAHDHSTFLAVNSSFVFEPEALDTALVMFAAIDSPAIGATESAVLILGSAWIDAGPFNPTEFDRYELSWAPLEVDEWTLIEESTTQACHDTLATWATSEMAPGDYRLRLTIRDDAGDSLVAPGTITLYDGCMELSGVLEEDLLELEWTACTVAEAYWIYGTANLVFFEPGFGPEYTHRLDTVEAETTSWSSSSGVGNANDNWTYLVIGVNDSEQELCRSNRFGEVDFLLP